MNRNLDTQHGCLLGARDAGLRVLRTSVLGLGLALLAAACGGQADSPDSNPDAGRVADPDAAQADAETSQADASPGVKVQSGCDLPEGPIVPVSSAQETASQLLGRWVHCTGEVPGYLKATGSIGIEFTGDGHWYLLGTASDGSVDRLQGFAHEGTWGVTDNSINNNSSWQVDINGTSGGAGCFPVFETSPRRVLMSFMGGPVTYIAVE